LKGKADLDKLLESFSTTLKLENTGGVTAYVDREGQITVDLRILQALFRGSLLENFKEKSSTKNFLTFGPTFLPEPFDATYLPSNATLDQQNAIRVVYEQVKEIEKIEGESHLGELFNDDSGLSSGWFSLQEITDYSNILQIQYIGTLLFLLTHEQGHIALQHYSRLQQLEHQAEEGLSMTNEDFCKWSEYFETEADIYAFILLSPLVGGNKSRGPLVDQTMNHITGYRNFFQYGYSLSEFSDKKGVNCSYPTNEQRYELVQDLHNLLVNGENAESIKKTWYDLKRKESH
jgi:hypothetical protein